MLYRRPKKRSLHLYSSFYRKPLPRSQRILFFIVAVFLLLFSVVSIILIQLRPLIFKMAKTAVTDVVGIEVNDVIMQKTLNGTFDYSKIVTLEKDDEGNITALVTNAALVNTLQTEISKGVFKYVNNEIVSELKIPIGNAIGSILFSGWGPEFTVKILSVADVDTKLSNEFESAGINQTHQKIYLDVWTDIDIVVPGYGMKTITVSTQVVVYDTFIVGEVPKVYADLGNSGGAS